MVEALWENGKYIGWKQGKPWWQNHGEHKFVTPANYNIIACEVCGVVSKETNTPLSELSIGSTRLSREGESFVAFIREPNG